MKFLLYKAIFLLAFCRCAFSQEIGLDVGQPINPSSGDINWGTDTAVVTESCTHWVRVNFILGPWASPGDQTLHGGRTWKQAYDEIINAYMAKGIQVYGLIGAEAYTYPADTMEQYPGNATNADAWIQNYTANFVQIVDMFKDRIRVYESFNEPNNWTNSSTAIVHAAWFAKMLQEVYLNVKYYNGHNSDPAWQVTLVSGALFTFDLNTGGQYINDTYWYGKNTWAWDWTHQNAGAYPLDGFGQHIYVEQASSNVAAVTTAMQNNLDDFWNNVYTYEDDVNKRIWISEFGWESNTYGEAFQAQNLTTGFNVLLNDWRVRLSLWFTQSDFPGVGWGLYYMGNYLPADQKQAFAAFKSLNSCNYTTGFTENNLQNIQLVKNNSNYLLRSGKTGRSQLTVHNLAGQPVDFSQKPVSKDAIQIDLESLPRGLYLLYVKSDEETRCFKLIQE